MNRLQKKCVIGTVGIHLLLLLILIVGPAFYNREPKMDNTQILDMIPANLVDAVVNSGVQNAQPPAPTPVVVPKPVQPLQSIPLPPKIVTPPTPTPTPTVTPNLTPTEHQPKPQQNNINVNTQLVKRTKPKNTPQHDNSQAVNNAVKNLSHQLSSSTKIDMPGNASASYASYASVVETVYEQALRPNLPGQVTSNSENTKVSITVSSDGTVISAHIISPSGDSAWDAAVQHTLDQVATIAPFPDGATDKERHYTLSFNPEVEKSFE